MTSCIKNSSDGGIYVIINNVNGYKYIGKSKNFKKRWYQHTHGFKHKKYNTKLYNAMRKYGIIKFSMELLDTTYSNECEIYWISKLSPEYNMTKGGDGGFINDQTGKTWKVKDTSNMKTANKLSAKVRTPLMTLKISGGKNYQCNYIISTPWGIFETWRNACNAAKLLRKSGVLDVITDEQTLKRYCKQSFVVCSKGRRTPAAFKGKSTDELGFSFKLKD